MNMLRKTRLLRFKNYQTKQVSGEKFAYKGTFQNKNVESKGLSENLNLYTANQSILLCNQRWRSSIPSAKRRPGADCGSDHECLIAKFKCKLKKVGKTTRPFRYDLNQILYNYTVEVTNRFKELDVPEVLWMEVCDIVQEAGIKTIPKKKKCKKAKWLSEQALQIAVKRREAKGKGEKERYIHLNVEFQR